MFPPRHPKYIIFSSLEIMPSAYCIAFACYVYCAITRPIAICDDTYKFVAYSYNILQEYAIDNKVMVTSHLEVVSKLHAWHIDFERIMKKCFC